MDYENRMETVKAEERSRAQKRIAELQVQITHHQEIIKTLVGSSRAQKGKEATKK